MPPFFFTNFSEKAGRGSYGWKKILLNFKSGFRLRAEIRKHWWCLQTSSVFCCFFLSLFMVLYFPFSISTSRNKKTKSDTFPPPKKCQNWGGGGVKKLFHGARSKLNPLKKNSPQRTKKTIIFKSSSYCSIYIWEMLLLWWKNRSKWYRWKKVLWRRIKIKIF